LLSNYRLEHIIVPVVKVVSGNGIIG
jgi:hypothetical protein